MSKSKCKWWENSYIPKRKELKYQESTEYGRLRHRNGAYVMAVHVARPSSLLNNFHQPLIIRLIHQPHPRRLAAHYHIVITTSHNTSSVDHLFYRLKLHATGECQGSISPDRVPVAHLHLKMSEATKPSASDWTPANLSEFLLAQKSGYLRAVAEDTHKDDWTISMGNEAGG